MPTDIAEMAEMQDTAQQTGTTTPEHHQTQAAAGSPQAGGAPASNVAPGSAQAGSATASRRPATGAPQQAGMPQRRNPSLSPMSLLPDPLGMMRSMMDQMDRLFEGFLGYPGSRSRPASMPSALQGTGGGYGTTSLWYPQIEVSERGDNLVVCADLPGLKKEDVHLEVHDDRLVLQGERRNEQSQNEGGLYRTERSYGSFYRAIPLPEGVEPDQVKASFKDGVLEVTVPVPNRRQQLQGRKIEIT